MNPNTEICPDCGNAIQSSALAGLCPFCLAASVADDLRDRTQRGSAAVVAPASHQQIGPYRLLGRLGEGGYGVVYRAQQERPVRRLVAIKIMKGGVVSEQAVARFEAERQALAMMEHPSIAHVFDVGETADGLPFFVMELIDGLPISSYCDEHQLSPEARLRLFRQVCEAVGHAHRRGIIHRDLKPSNILVTREESEALPKVIDFGIAKATETLLTERTLVTRDHQLVGTLAYMSPEQASMTGADVDTRSDIYSLGALLFELLTGTTPFGIEELAELPYDEALRRVRTQDPPRPSARCRELANSGGSSAGGAGIAADLDWIVMKALEKDPERRYETAGALGRDIDRYLDGEAIEARPPTAAYLAGKFVRKHRVPVLASAAVLLAMLAGTIVSLVMYLRAESEAGRAEWNEGLAAKQAALAVESEQRGKAQFSKADFMQATPLLDDRRPALAVAHLARAVRTNPANHAASARLLETLAVEHWARPALVIPARGPAMAYSPDGARLVIVVGNSSARGERPEILVLGAASGEILHRLQPDAYPRVPVVDPRGQEVAVGMQDGTVSMWDLETGKETWRSAAGSGDPIGEIRFSQDGQWLLATSAEEQVARVWNVATKGLHAEINLAAKRQVGGGGVADFSPDGGRVVFGAGADLAVFDLSTKGQVGAAMQHDGKVLGVRFLPGGRRVVTWSDDATARLWDTDSGTALLTLQHEKPVLAAAVSPDGSRLLTGTGLDGGARSPSFSRLWDLETGTLIGKPIEHPSDLRAVAFSADGTKAATGCLVHRLGDGAVRVLDGQTGEVLLAPIFHPRGAERLEFSPDGTHLVVGSRHVEAVVWDLRMRVFEPVHIAAGNAVWRAVFEPGDRSVITMTFGGIAQRWDAANGEPLSKPETFGPVAVAGYSGVRDTLRDGFKARREHRPAYQPALLGAPFQEGTPSAAAASDDGELLLTGGQDGRLRVWSVADGVLRYPALLHGELAVTAVGFSADGRVAASAGQDGRVLLWDVAGGRLIASQQMHRGAIQMVSFAPDGKCLATASEDGTARLWWLDQEVALSPPLDNGGWVNYVAFSPDGNTLASSGRDNAARLWEVRSGCPLAAPMRHIDTATYGLFLLWSPDSRRLVTAGSHDNTARIWDAQGGAMLAKPMEQPTAALSAALRPDGGALLFGDDHDFQARVWDLASSEPITPLLKHDERVWSCAFDSTGGRIVTGTVNGSAYLWDVAAPREPLPDWFLAYAEALAGFRFNAEGVLEQVPGGQLAAARGEVARRATDVGGGVGGWMRWLTAEVDQQTISPHSTVTVQDHIATLVRRDSVESLQAALHLQPGAPLIMGKLGVRLVIQLDPSGRDLRYGGFLARRAVQLDPRNAKLRLLLAAVKLQERLRGIGASAVGSAPR